MLLAQSPTKNYISGLKANLNLSPYSAHKSSNHKFSQIYKISPDTNLSHTHTHTHTHTKKKKKHTHKKIQHKIFEDNLTMNSVFTVMKLRFSAKMTWWGSRVT